VDGSNWNSLPGFSPDDPDIDISSYLDDSAEDFGSDSGFIESGEYGDKGHVGSGDVRQDSGTNNNGAKGSSKSARRGDVRLGGSEEEKERQGLGQFGPNARHVDERGDGGSGNAGNVETDKGIRQIRGSNERRRDSERVDNREQKSDELSRLTTTGRRIYLRRNVVVQKNARRTVPDFQKAVFEAALTEAKFGVNGDMLIRFSVGPEFADEAVGLRKAFGLQLTLGIYRKRYVKENPDEVDHE